MGECNVFMRLKDYYSVSNIRQLAGQGGVRYSFKKNVIAALMFVFAITLIAFFYRIRWELIIILIAVALLFMPILIYQYYNQKKENKRFNDVDIYLHQMAYSFQRYPKINLALSDTAKVATGNMSRLINKAIMVLESSDSDKVYYKALKVIEQEYNCERIITLHRFLISIEERGGSYGNSLEILIDDFDSWVNRVYKYQKDVMHVKVNTYIGIILSCLIASVSVMISSILSNTSGVSLDITGEWMYQVVSLVFIILCLLFYVFIQLTYCKSWINNERTDNKIMKDYNLVFNKQSESVKIFAYSLSLIGIIVSIYVSVRLNVFAGIVSGIFSIYIFFVPQVNKKQAFKRIREDVYIGFTEWLRDVVINLQQEPLQSAIESSYDNCPIVLRNSLSRFIMALEENPTDVRPYYQFCSEFGVLDISSTVKILYSVSELSKDSTESLLNTLIKRNYELVNKHDEIRNRDSLGLLKFGEYIPMLFVSIKIAVDMLLVITGYL